MLSSEGETERERDMLRGERGKGSPEGTKTKKGAGAVLQLRKRRALARQLCCIPGPRNMQRAEPGDVGSTFTPADVLLLPLGSGQG